MNLLNKIKNIGSDQHSSSGHTEDWYIIVERGEGIRDENAISKSDTYLLIDFGGKHEKTRTIKNNRNPIWNQTFHFKLTPDQAQNLHIKLKDEDIGPDDDLGKTTISRADLPSQIGEEKYFKLPLYHEHQASGVIHIRVKRLIDGQPLQSTQPMYQSSNVSSTTYPQQTTQPQYFSGQQQPMSYGQQQPMSYGQQQQPMSYGQPYNQGQQGQMNPPQPQSQQQYSNEPRYYGQHRY